VVGVADEPVQDAGDAGRVSMRKVRRIERGRLCSGRAILVRHSVTFCSRQNSEIDTSSSNKKLSYRRDSVRRPP